MSDDKTNHRTLALCDALIEEIKTVCEKHGAELIDDGISRRRRARCIEIRPLIMYQWDKINTID